MTNNASNKLKAVTGIRGVHNLWGDWAIAFGAITFVDLLSYVIPKMIFPIVVFAIAWLMGNYSNSTLSKNGISCARVPSLASRTIFITAVVQLILVIVYRLDSRFRIFQPETVNHSVPYITALIIYPAGFFTMLSGYLRYGKTSFCRTCRLNNTFTPESEPLSNKFLSLARRQILLMMIICLVITVVTWTYYFVYYINVNINTPDKFFYFIVPVLGYIASLIYLLTQYSSFIAEIKESYMKSSAAVTATSLRFIVLRGDAMLINEMPTSSAQDFHPFDTPAKLNIPFRKDLDTEQARDEFRKLSGIDSFFIRPLYHNCAIDRKSNIFHYAVILPEDEPIPSQWFLGHNWVTLPEIDRLLKIGLLATPLREEMHRIFTITMAWKTYDRSGRRLYPIKNYHPTFRLRDLKDWDVDYNDLHWIRVADLNQDRPFFRIRNLMRKITNALC